MPGFLLDENLSKRMIEGLLPLFSSVIHVRDIPLTNFFDAEIWEFARKENHVII
jgi:predicted nuclease of predicted toxin-antitoxin system